MAKRKVLTQSTGRGRPRSAAAKLRDESVKLQPGKHLGPQDLLRDSHRCRHLVVCTICRTMSGCNACVRPSNALNRLASKPVSFGVRLSLRLRQPERLQIGRQGIDMSQFLLKNSGAGQMSKPLQAWVVRATNREAHQRNLRLAPSHAPLFLGHLRDFVWHCRPWPNLCIVIAMVPL